jgi:putative glutamine amidotransferase
MSVPLIGITTSRLLTDKDKVLINMHEAYVQSVVKAGGVPVLIPTGISPSSWANILSHLSGVLITGGADVDPARYHGEHHPTVYGIDPDRDALEIFLVQQCAQANLPLLGICRGIQVINVALGGTLYADIVSYKPGALKHDWFPDWPRDYLAHEIRLVKDSQIINFLSPDHHESDGTIKVNSMHHQGVCDLGPTLKPVAFSPDGLVEAVELVGHPFGVGVQWHPECLPEIETMRALFRGFIDAAKIYVQHPSLG